MKTSLILTAALLSATLSACTDRPDKSPVPHTNQASGMFQDERNTLDQAKTVEKTLETRAEADKKALEQQTR